MLKGLAGAELFVLTLVCFAVASCLLCSVVAPGALARRPGWAPAERHVALGLLCAGSLLSALTLFAVALTPALASLADPTLDHCLAHDDGHAHLCFVHAPASAPHAVLWIGLALVNTYLLGQAMLVVARACVAAASCARSPAPAWIASRARASCWMTRQPHASLQGSCARIRTSRGLLSVLTSAQRKAMFATSRATNGEGTRWFGSLLDS